MIIKITLLEFLWKAGTTLTTQGLSLLMMIRLSFQQGKKDKVFSSFQVKECCCNNQLFLKCYIFANEAKHTMFLCLGNVFPLLKTIINSAFKTALNLNFDAIFTFRQEIEISVLKFYLFDASFPIFYLVIIVLNFCFSVTCKSIDIQSNLLKK